MTLSGISRACLTACIGLTAGLSASMQAVSAGELQISGYSGYISSPHSHVDSTDAGTSYSNSVGWEGKPFEMPPFWGARVTYWTDRWENWGGAIDFAHSKVYADLSGGVGGVYNTLEFTDGLNLLTANVLYRHPNNSRFTPYVGVGAGIAIPHVEVEFVATGNETFEYQATGPAVQGLIGVDIAITDHISTFVEYKANYSWNEADLAGGGSLETNILSNQFIVGLTYKFDNILSY
jgi:lipid A oxidase